MCEQVEPWKTGGSLSCEVILLLQSVEGLCGRKVRTRRLWRDGKREITNCHGTLSLTRTRAALFSLFAWLEPRLFENENTPPDYSSLYYRSCSHECCNIRLEEIVYIYLWHMRKKRRGWFLDALLLRYFKFFFPITIIWLLIYN